MTELEKTLTTTVKELLATIETKDALIEATEAILKERTKLVDDYVKYVKAIMEALEEYGYRSDQIPKSVRKILEWYEAEKERADKYEDKYYLLRGYVRCVVGIDHNEAFKKMLSSVKGMKELRKMKNKPGK